VNRLVLAMLPLLLSTVGCTVLLTPGEAQCETAKDCEGRGFAGAVCVKGVCEEAPVVDPVWGCLGDVVEPVPDKTKSFEFSIGLVFAGSKAPVTTATVDICDKLDITCTGTAANFPKGLKPGPDGVLKVSLIQGFDGFVRITSPDIVDSRVYVGRPIVAPPVVKEVWLLPPSDYDVLAAAAKLTVDPARGTAILLAHDCQGLAVGGVRFESPNADADSTEFYLTNQFPTTPPAATSTDVDGYGGFFNLPTGASVARSIRDEDHASIGESSFQIFANTISYVQISPTPK